jgi:hypothetical protein
MTIKCELSFVDDILEGTKNPPKDPDKLVERINDFIRKMRAVASTPAENGDALITASREQAETMFRNSINGARMVSISPSVGKGLEFQLAQNVGLLKAGAGFLDRFTEPGLVKYIMGRLEKIGGGSVHQMLANIRFLDGAIQADRALETIRKRLRISRDDWHRIKLDAYEIGFQPYAQRDFGALGPVATEFMLNRQKRFFSTLKRHGVDQTSADTVARYTQSVVDNFRSTLEILHGFGVKINSVDELINYLPRSFSPETLRRFAWVKKGPLEYDIFDFDGSMSRMSLPSAFVRGRNSDFFIIEDKIVFDELMRAADPEMYTKLGVEGIDDLLTDTGALHKAFVDILDNNGKTVEVFDALVENGMIAKVPMLSTELYDYALRRYKLPFKNMSEFMPYSFEDMANAYRSQSERLVGRSLMAHYTAKGAIEGGWGVTEAQKLADPGLYSNWVKLTSPSDPNVVISASEARRFGIPEYTNSHVYVHPVVAEIYKAQVSLFSDPNQMGFLGRLMNDLHTTFSAMAVASSGFVFRQLYTPVFQIWAGGGRIDTYVRDMARVMPKLGEIAARGRSFDTFDEMFDNTAKKFRLRGGEYLTERELWQYARSQGVVTDIIPWLGQSVQKKGYAPTANSVEALRRTARYLGDILDNHKDLGYAGVLSESYSIFSNGARRVSDRMFHVFALFNVLYDNMGRFSLLKSLTDDSTANQAIRRVNGNWKGTFDFQNAVAEMENYFPRYDNPGNFDQFMRFYRPFYMFASRNMFATARMMVRRPGRFMAYQRLFAVMNDPERTGTEDVPLGAMPDWMRSTSPLTWVRRDENGEPVEMFTLPRSSFDPVAEGTAAVTGTLDYFLMNMGVWPQSMSPNIGIDDKMDALPWERTQTNKALRSLVSQSYGAWQSAYGAITGEDPRTGYRITRDPTQTSSFLGAEVSPMFRYIAETTFPILRNVNRSNPFYLFGRPPEFDEEGNLVDAGTPSWLGVSRSSRDRTADFREEWQRLLSVVGFNVYSIDVMESMGYRQQDFVYSLGQGYKALAKKRAEFGQLTTERERTIALQQIREMEILLAALHTDYNEIVAWGQEHDMAFPAAVRFMRRNNMQQHNVETMSPEEREKILQYVYGEAMLGGPNVETVNPFEEAE